jgi:hypothetical protein
MAKQHPAAESNGEHSALNQLGAMACTSNDNVDDATDLACTSGLIMPRG